MEEIRKYFPVTAQNTYLDTATCGLISQQVTNWRREHDKGLEGVVSAFRVNAKPLIEGCKQTIADFFGAKAHEIGLVPNYSYAINMLLESMSKGQKILILANDYPSVTWPVEHRDFDICYAEIDENLEENIEAAIKKHKPDIFIFSIVQWLNGIKIDLDFLKRIKKEHPNLMLFADGTQYLATERFNFEESGIDILATSCYKWLAAGFGTGFMIIREDARDKIFPQTIGFFSAETFESDPKDTLFMRYFEPGHFDTLGFGSLEQSLLFVDRMGQDKLYNHIKSLSAKAKEHFAEMGLLKQDTLLRKDHSSIFNLKGSEALFEKLQNENIIATLRGGGIRVGFHYYNSEEDLDRLVKALQ